MSHLILVARGQYKAGNTALAQEEWSNTIRLALSTASIDDVGTLQDWTPEDHTETVDDPAFTVETNFNVVDTLTTNDFNPVNFLQNEALSAWTNMLLLGPISNKVDLTDLTLYPIAANTGKVMEVDGLPGVKARAQLAWKAGNFPTGQAGDMASADVSGVISWRSIRRDAKGRGRMYLPGIRNIYISTTTDTQGVFDTAYQTSTSSAAVTFLNDLSGNSGAWGFDPCVIGRPWTTYAKITSVYVGRNPGTQRRRTNKVEELYMVTPK